MATPRFSLRTLFAATAAISALLASALVRNKTAAVLIAFVAATVLPAALLTAAIRSRGYARSFCLGALIPASLMCLLVALAVSKYVATLTTGIVYGLNPPPRNPPYLRDFATLIHDSICYLPFGFGVASLVAGMTALATHWLLGESGEEKRANDQDETD